jgi:nucleoside triphosphate diphosphatase
MSLEKLKMVMKSLRNPKTGCPWDLEQDFASIAPYTIEEAYEVQEALRLNDMENFKEELGDLLFQIVFQAQLADEKGLFNFDDIASGVANKMISRHPHVFGENPKQDTAKDVEKIWESLKEIERQGSKKINRYILDDVPLSLPSTIRGQKLQKKAAKVGFDWPDAKSVLEKLDEEVEELKDALREDDKTHIAEELGDVMFVLVNLARKLDLDAEQCLKSCNDKFTKRFNGIEDVVRNSGKKFQDYSLEELENIWQEQKKIV